MKAILSIPIIVFALIFELLGRVLSQIAEMSIGVAVMLLSAISNKSE